MTHPERQRSALTTEDWNVHFLVRLDGRVVGVQSVHARQFAITSEVSTGSWLGLAHQGRGVGTEMRAAVLLLAFEHLGAVCARSSAFTDNAASNRVSAKLGYRPDGTGTWARRGARAEQVRLLVTPATFARPGWKLDVDGLDGCRGLLGAG